MAIQNGRKPSNALSVASAALVTLAFLAGCFPTPAQTNTPVPTPACAPIYANNDVGLSLIRLPDGTEIQLQGNTEIQISMAGCLPGLAQHLVLVQHGVVAGKAGSGGGIVLAAPGSYFGQADGLAVVSYSPEGGRFQLDCVAGPCGLGPDSQHLTPLDAGQGGQLDQSGNVNAPTAIDDAALFSDFGDWLGIAPPPTATPDLAATATSGCATFEAQFPATPCP